MTGHRLTIGLGEYDTGWHDPAASLVTAEKMIRAAADIGIDAMVLPEMATTGFTMDTSRAVTLDSPDVAALRRMARQHGVWLVAGMALRTERAEPCVTNSALALDPSGEIAAVHHKQRLFAFGQEDAHYAPGTAATTLQIGGVRVGLLICYELRFPELFSAVAAGVDAIILIANWPKARQGHWDALLRARAIENQCYVIGVNRTGVANGQTYIGGSSAYDPWGELVTNGGDRMRMVAVESARVAEVRAHYPFLRDRTN